MNRQTYDWYVALCTVPLWDHWQASFGILFYTIYYYKRFLMKKLECITTSFQSNTRAGFASFKGFKESCPKIVNLSNSTLYIFHFSDEIPFGLHSLSYYYYHHHPINNCAMKLVNVSIYNFKFNKSLTNLPNCLSPKVACFIFKKSIGIRKIIL